MENNTALKCEFELKRYGIELKIEEISALGLMLGVIDIYRMILENFYDEMSDLELCDIQKALYYILENYETIAQEMSGDIQDDGDCQTGIFTLEEIIYDADEEGVNIGKSYGLEGAMKFGEALLMAYGLLELLRKFAEDKTGEESFDAYLLTICDFYNSMTEMPDISIN